MNYLDLFRVLKKTNCGKCGMPTCISFALSVAKGDKSARECPFLEQADAEKFSTIVKTDWKQDLICDLRQEVSGLRLASLAEGLGAEYTDNRLRLRCLGMDYFVDGNGMISTTGHVNPWIEILILHYVRTSGNQPLSGKWISFSELKGGLIKASSFVRECEEPLRRIIDSGPDEFGRKILRLGGEPFEDFACDYGWLIRPLPKVPFLLQYWKADQEFESAAKILFDSSADSYLDVESFIFLGEGLIETLRRIPAASTFR